MFDLENKFVAYSGTFVEGVRDVVSEWGNIYVLTNDGKVQGILSWLGEASANAHYSAI